MQKSTTFRKMPYCEELIVFNRNEVKQLEAMVLAPSGKYILHRLFTTKYLRISDICTKGDGSGWSVADGKGVGGQKCHFADVLFV